MRSPKTTMPPYQIPLTVAERFRSRVAEKSTTYTRAYEEALTWWCDGGDTPNSRAAFCPEGMALLPSVAVDSATLEVMDKLAFERGGWEKLMAVVLRDWLRTQHREPKEPKIAAVVSKRTAEEQEASLRSVAARRFEQRLPPVVGGVVFKHRPPHPRPWEIINLPSPMFEGWTVWKQVHPKALEQYARETGQELPAPESPAPESLEIKETRGAAKGSQETSQPEDFC